MDGPPPPPPPPPPFVPPPPAAPPPPPPGYSGAYGYGAYGSAGPRRTNGLAIAALVLGIVGIPLYIFAVPALLALIFGLVAAGRVKRSLGTQSGLGMARAGWILGVVGLSLFAMVMATLAISDDFEDELGTVVVTAAVRA